MERSKVTNAVISWNLRFPVDRWWRMRHNVPFMSPVHRETSFLDQMFEYEEEKMFLPTKTEDDTDKYVPGIGEMFKERAAATLQEFTAEAKNEIAEMLKMENNGGK